jgi:pyruvate dehydrogenase E2 component (dihydrolipoamide acetyltransferase)
MAQVVGLPRLSPTMEEGTLTRWAKQEGDEIALDDLIAEVETDKATMEWRAFDRAVLLKILVQEGQTVAPDTPVAIFGARGEDISSLLSPVQSPESPRAAPPAAKPEHLPASPHGGPAPRDVMNASAASLSGATANQPAQQVTGRFPASPSVRRLARERGVDLQGVQGSGPGGRIVQRDLERSAPQPSETQNAPRAAAQSDRSGLSAANARPAPVAVPLSSMRRTIARRLVESKQNVPHFYLSADVRVDALLSTRQELNALLAEKNEKISLNDMLIRVCANALRRVPSVNASFTDDAILLHQVVDVSVAVALPDGLVTPVVRDADKKGLLEIAREVRELAAQARQKKLKPEQMSGGTFSISNLGMYGVDEFAAVINPPEGAIVAVGAVREVPAMRDHELQTQRCLRLTLSCDHRVVDGAAGAEWLAAAREIIESPLQLML